VGTQALIAGYVRALRATRRGVGLCRPDQIAIIRIDKSDGDDDARIQGIKALLATGRQRDDGIAGGGAEQAIGRLHFGGGGFGRSNLAPKLINFIFWLITKFLMHTPKSKGHGMRAMQQQMHHRRFFFAITAIEHIIW
jgi:hypothetical protein